MKAIGYLKSLPVDNEQSLIDIELPMPEVTGRDLLIKINAIAVNPVDCKIRQNVQPDNDEFKVLGWDATGEVVATGSDVSYFKPGDLVYYAGDLTRSGTNAEYQLVDERLAGRKPVSLSDAEAAALPLTTITAWELLFERLGIEKSESTDQQNVLLIVGASGGVGSILIQLAKQLTNTIVIATASRETSQAWVKELGADYVVNHNEPLPPQIETLSVGPISHVASLTHTDTYLDSYIEVLKPMGKLALIDDPKALDVLKLKSKSISLHWEFMFTRSMHQTEDMETQHNLLNEAANLIDEGKLRTTLGQHLGNINAKNLRQAHEVLESGKSIGKLVLEHF